MPIHLIPQPRSLSPLSGRFTITANTTFGSNSPAAQSVAEAIAAQFYQLFGIQIPTGTGTGATIHFTLDPSTALPPEGYQLEITPEGIQITAGDPAGAFYGGQSLLQLFEPESRSFPAIRLEDAPRFGWRGLMLDSARYYQPVSWIKKWLDVMALHKFNVLHWHLTEDQGWRVEVKALPQLTEISAWRKETRVGHELGGTVFDGRIHGGFYTGEEMRAIVAYAAARNITVIPEIEMPGHSQAVLAAFPNLSCTGATFEVSTRWGVHEEVFCAGNDAVFQFLETVLDEVLEIFPSKIIHLGGDECPKARWKTCPKCQARIQAEGLHDEDELQSWFIRRMANFLERKGRRLAGWDEILEGGLASGAVVMSWRGTEGGITAARAGHDVVMAPNQETYLDYYQSEDKASEPLAIGGHLPLRRVYDFEPIPAELTPEEASHILGGQGQLWTEYMPTTDSIEYMALPRACALSEVLWSNSNNKDYAAFHARLQSHLPLLDRMRLKYRPLTD